MPPPDGVPIEYLPTPQLEIAFDSFFRVTSDWLRAWTGLRPPWISTRSEEASFSFYLSPPRAGLRFSAGSPQFLLVAYGQRSATLQEFEAAVVCGIRLYPLPAPYALLYRAGWDLMRQDFRQAVIDSCTAPEVALANSVRSRLTALATPAETIKSTLKRADGVVDLFRLWVILGARPGVSEGRVMAQLAEPRNEAAHGGAVLSHPIAEAAMATAEDLVRGATPLPGPGRVATLARRYESVTAAN